MCNPVETMMPYNSSNTTFCCRYALTDKQFKLTHVNLNFLYYYDGFEEAG